MSAHAYRSIAVPRFINNTTPARDRYVYNNNNYCNNCNDKNYDSNNINNNDNSNNSDISL